MQIYDRLKRVKFLACCDKVQNGFSLVEVIIAMLLLLVAILGFVPLYSYVHSNLIMNRTKVVAYNLAKNRIETIKSVGWLNIGTHRWKTDTNGNFILNGANFIRMNGSPNGPFLQTKNVIQNGTPISQSDCETGETPTVGNNGPITYNMTTTIQWEPDQSRGLSSGVVTDYKDIVVTVKATNGSKIFQDVTLSAKISMEGEQQTIPGGNIIVVVQRGWNLNPGQPIPAENIQINLTGPDGIFWSQNTGLKTGDWPGEAFLAGLTPYGTWTMNAADSNGMMVMPGTGKTGVANQAATVADTSTAYLTVLAEIPSYINLNFQDGVTGEPVIINGSTDTVTLQWPSQIGKTDQLPSTFSGSLANQSDFGESGLWPVGAGCSGTYSLKVLFTTANYYNDYDNSKANDWDGKFNNPGENKTVIVKLVPSPKVTVRDSSNNMPIPNSTASVTLQLYLDTYTYSGVAWGNRVQGTTLIATGDNDSNGDVLFKNLPDNQQAPATPANGNTYDTYRIVVSNSVPGYQPASPIDDAFWAQGGYTMQCQGGQQVQSKVALDTNSRGPIYIDLTPTTP